MNARLAWVWLRERMIRGAFDANVAAEEDRPAREARLKAERQHASAVDEIDRFLDGDVDDEVSSGPSVERAEWLRAMGAEVA